MSLSAVIIPATLDTVLGPLALLFLTGAAGDPAAARNAASQMLAAHNAETPEELRLAAEVISFGLHALDALRQAADPELSLNQKSRLRGSAISLSRESHKAQRKLDQLQRARLRPQPADARPEPQPSEPEVTDSRSGTDPAPGLIEFARKAIESAGKGGGKTWTKAFQQRLAAKRIAENLKKQQARLGQPDTAMPIPTVSRPDGQTADIATVRLAV